MNEDKKGYLTIRYVNGTKQKFEYIRQGDTANIASNIREVLNANQLLLELGDRVLIVPFQNVQSIELSPPPVKLPPIAIKNVRFLS